MKSFILLALGLFLFSFAPQASEKNPTDPPYVSALPMTYSGQYPSDYIDIWVRWEWGTVLTQDYYADVSVTYQDWCSTHTITVHCIVKAGGFMSFTDIPVCQGASVITYSLVGWGPA